MENSGWTVVTTPPARSERWASWISARKTFEAPLLPLALAAGAWITKPPVGYSGVQMLLVGFLLAASFLMWERAGFRQLLSRHEAELARLRDRATSA
jgi:hypothetical protein